MQAIQRIHHVSALGGRAQDIINFYRQVLEIDLIKATVNFSGGDRYHLFFANQQEKSQAAMTYFDWSDQQAGHFGGGQVGQTAFRIPKNSMAGWENKFQDLNIKYKKTERYGKTSLEFHDPFTNPLALVEGQKESKNGKIYDFHGVELLSTDYQATRTHLKEILNLKEKQENNHDIMFEIPSSPHQVLILVKQDLQRRALGIGTVDHLALEIGRKKDLDEWRDYLSQHGFKNTDLTGQNFKKSSYYREPGHVRIELTTQGLGMMVRKESTGQLGTEVVIPDHLNNKKEDILSHLPSLDLNRKDESHG